MSKLEKPRVGTLRPTQLMHTYGIGAIVDLPRISVIVTGLEDWPSQPPYTQEIDEDRLKQAVRYIHPDVKRLLSPPQDQSGNRSIDPFSEEAQIGVPVATFPRWMVCPECRLLAPIGSKLFKLKPNFYYPERTAYQHEGCPRSRTGKSPDVVPARFMVACENGHLDDFPWEAYVHRGEVCEKPLLRLIEFGPSGEARDLEVRCESCGKKRRLSQAFGQENRNKMPICKGRRPQLRDFDPDECELHMRPIILGASNTWFSVIQNIIAIPVGKNKLEQLINDSWSKFGKVQSKDQLQLLREIGQLGGLSVFSNKDIWEGIKEKRKKDEGELPDEGPPDLKSPEWEIFTNPDPNINSPDFQLREVNVPSKYSGKIKTVVLVERLREVRAMLGFTRVDAAGELTDPDLGEVTNIAPISRKSPTWVPANEVRGEGIFIQFDEDEIQAWLSKEAVKQRADDFFIAHKKWRKARMIEPAEEGFPGMRYVFLHTFSHSLMRQLSLECGYSSASIRERIYSHPGDGDYPAMAGALIYTAAPDSEGTLGGLVSLGETETLEKHISQAVEDAHLCSSDPLCAENPPSMRGQTLHAAACHSCLFAPETACERGNKYLDRSVLVPTVEIEEIAFFG